MNTQRAIWIIALAALGWSACESDDVLIDPGFDYFPVERGRYVDYEVDSIYHDVPSGIQDTFHFYVRELIDTTYFDAESRPTNRIERYYKEELADDWTIRDVWVANRTNSTGEKVEENVRFVKMVFPVEPDVMWDGNAQNTMDTWDYSYDDLFNPKTIGDTTYASTVTIIQRDVENLIQSEQAREIYAQGVGMVYKELDTLKFTLENGISELETGVELQMTAIATGVLE
ncbi:MAG: hypothetical protein HKN79_06480 [Flavobacteriales bacterium]|nr:hypothetical protein [Flavobacteriales bacterium]